MGSKPPRAAHAAGTARRHDGGRARRAAAVHAVSRAAPAAARAEGLSAELVTGEEAAGRLFGRWDDLALRLGRPYCTPAWMLAWWRRMAPGGAELRIVSVTEGERLVALAPFYREPFRGIGRLRLLASDVSVRLDVLCEPGREAEVAPLIAGELHGAGLVALEGCPSTSPWPEMLGRDLPPRGAWRLRDNVVPAPWLDLRGRSFDSWLAGKSKNFRGQMGQSRRRLERQGARVFRAVGEDEIRRAVSALERLHEGRWEWRGGSAVLREGLTDMLVDAALALEDSERCRLWCVEIDGELVSVQLFLAAGGEVAYWLGGFDDEYAHGRPAFVAILAAIEDAMRRGEGRFDLGGGGQRYKYRFSDGEDTLGWHVLAPRGTRYPLARAALLPRSVRRMAASRLSPETRARLRGMLGARSGEAS